MKNRKFCCLVAYKRKLSYCIIPGGVRLYAFTQKEKRIRSSLYFYREWNKLNFYVNPLGLKANLLPF